MSVMITRPVTFTIAEIWLLVSVIKHEMQDAERWKWPITNKPLVEELMLACLTCEDAKLEEFTLELSEGDCLLIDYNITPDMKTPEGAIGKNVLLKVFRALSELSYGYDTASREDDRIVNKRVVKDAVERSD